MLNVRKMQPADIEYGLQLCRLSHWNQLEADWLNLFNVSPDGVFVAEWDNQICATASAVNYGTKLGWIGMILVHPDFRRRGIASVLMNKCIEHLKSLKVESIKLDATDQGRPVYAKLGFIDEQPVGRYIMDKKTGQDVNSKNAADWAKIQKNDFDVFGADRLALLKTLGSNGFSSQLFKSDKIFGYGFARLGFDASYVGPIVASDKNIASIVFNDLLRQLPAGRIYIDVILGNKDAAGLADSAGFKITRELMRMYLGSPGNYGKTESIYAIAGFEIG